MTSPSADETYEGFKTALRETVAQYDDDPIMQFQIDNGMADWSLNDEEHELLEGLTKNQLAKVVAHVVMVMFNAQDRYIDSIAEESTHALDLIERDEESTDEERILATEIIEASALAQADGFRHCTALVYGWGLAAIAADESQSVDWDSIFTAGSKDEEKNCE